MRFLFPYRCRGQLFYCYGSTLRHEHYSCAFRAWIANNNSDRIKYTCIHALSHLRLLEFLNFAPQYPHSFWRLLYPFVRLCLGITTSDAICWKFEPLILFLTTGGKSAPKNNLTLKSSKKGWVQRRSNVLLVKDKIKMATSGGCSLRFFEFLKINKIAMTIDMSVNVMALFDK